jgi:hypothetical protein
VTDVGNLYTNLGGYSELFCVKAYVGNLDAKLGVTLCIFFFLIAVMANFFILDYIDPMAIIIVDNSRLPN